MPATSAQKAAAVLMSEQENNLNDLQNSPDKQADVPQNAAATTNRRLTQEGLKYEKIKKCTGINYLLSKTFILFATSNHQFTNLRFF